MANFSLAQRFIKSDEEIRRAQIAVVFGNFVFENQMIAECIPGQLANQAMILMQIVSSVSKYQVGFETSLNRRDEFLDRFALVRKITIAEIPDHHVRTACVLQKRTSGLASFAFSHRIRTEYHPVKLELGIFLDQAKDRAAASDFDVVAMRAQAQDSANPATAAAEGQLMHVACRRKSARPPSRRARCWLLKEHPRLAAFSKLPTARGRKPACLPEFDGL